MTWISSLRFGFVFNQKTVLMSMYSQDGVTGNRITALPEITEKKKKLAVQDSDFWGEKKWSEPPVVPAYC